MRPYVKGAELARRLARTVACCATDNADCAAGKGLIEARDSVALPAFVYLVARFVISSAQRKTLRKTGFPGCIYALCGKKGKSCVTST